MTTTEVPTTDDERAARLARLRERREPDAVTGRPAAPEPTPTAGRTGPPASPNPIAATSRPRRSPATSAKIVTVGASATAVLGMIAGYGIADGMTSDEPVGAPAPVADMTAAPASILPASPTVTPPADQPQVVVVVVDAATARTLSTSNGTGDLTVDLATIGIPPAGSTPTAANPATPVPATDAPTAAPTPVPVAAPAAVDLAVPAPPPPPAPRAAPAPQPQATSSGS